MDNTNGKQGKIGGYRWTICALVFFATTINYVDRNVISLLADTIIPLIKWSPESTGKIEWSWVTNAFQAAYAIGLLCVGRLMDFLGSKIGYGLALLGWSIAAIAHAFAGGFLSFCACRVALGATEAGNFPAAQKTVAEWFPKKERALATGLYNSGTNIGAILAPLVVPWLASHYILGWSWEWAFVITGAIGLLWLAFWFGIYKSPKEKLADGKLSQAEYDYIHSDADEKAENTEAAVQEKVPWGRLFQYRQTWAFFFGKFFTDPIWWFYLFWLPIFLIGENTRRIQEAFAGGLPEGITLAGLTVELKSFSSLFGATPMLDKLHLDGLIIWPAAVAVVYTISCIGSVFGGYLPKLLADLGLPISRARKRAMFIYALFPLTVLAAIKLGAINMWFAVIVIGIGAAAHQAWSANIFTTVPDMFPKKAVGSVTGIGGMAGTLGSFLFQPIVGLLLNHYEKAGNLTAGYSIIFVVCAVAYLLAWLVMHAFAPRFEKVADL